MTRTSLASNCLNDSVADGCYFGGCEYARQWSVDGENGESGVDATRRIALFVVTSETGE